MDKRVINLALSFCFIIIVSYIAITQIKKNTERKENADNQIYDDGVKRTFVNQDEILAYLEEKNDDEDFECSYEYEDYFLVFYSKQNKDKSSEDIFLKYYQYSYSSDGYFADLEKEIDLTNTSRIIELSQDITKSGLGFILFDKNISYASAMVEHNHDLLDGKGDTVVGFRLAFLFYQESDIVENKNEGITVYKYYFIDEDYYEQEPGYKEYYDEESSAYFRDYK